MAKKNSRIFEVFLQGVGLYFSNIDRFLLYMLFPILFQILGLFLIISVSYCYNEYYTLILSSVSFIKTPLHMQILLGVVLLPCIFIYLKGLWNYIVAYSAVNSMTENMLKSERVYDFPAHTTMVTRRWLSYIGIWLLYGAILLLTLIPVFLVFGWILLIYYAFIFQIFIFEPDLSPADCFKRSSSYVAGNFKQILCLILLLGCLTYIILPQLILTFLTTVKAVSYLQNLLTPFISLASLDNINMVFSAMGLHQIMPAQVSLFIIQALVFIIVIQFLLPLRVICMCLWYKNFYNDAGAMKKIDDKILARAGASKSKKRKK